MSYGEFEIVAVRRLRHPHPTGMPDPAHKAGRSTRWIAEEMTLSRRTVTTIIDKRNGSDPTTTKHREQLGLEPKRKDWRRAAMLRLPKQATAHFEKGRELMKEAKGRR